MFHSFTNRLAEGVLAGSERIIWNLEDAGSESMREMGLAKFWFFIHTVLFVGLEIFILLIKIVSGLTQEMVEENLHVAVSSDGSSKNQQWRSAVAANGTPHHDGAASERCRLRNEILAKNFGLPPPNSYSSIHRTKQETRLIREDDASPLCLLKVTASHCPLESGFAMSRGQQRSRHRPPGEQSRSS